MNMDYPDPRHRRFIERLGAVPVNLVLMHHAHLVQGVEWFGGTPVFYSLGNLLWDHTEGLLQQVEGWAYRNVEEQMTGLLFRMEVHRTGITRVLASPFVNQDCEKLVWVTGSRGRAVLDRFVRLSSETAADRCGHLFRGQYVGRIAPDVMCYARRLYLQRDLLGLVRLAARLRPRHVRALGAWLRTWASRADGRSWAGVAHD